MSLAIIATDVITYLQLQIMNVNENNNDHLVLFGEDFPLLLLCMLLQVLVITFWVRLGNNMYFRINPPSGACWYWAAGRRNPCFCASWAYTACNGR